MATRMAKACSRACVLGLSVHTEPQHSQSRPVWQARHCSQALWHSAWVCAQLGGKGGQHSCRTGRRTGGPSHSTNTTTDVPDPCSGSRSSCRPDQRG